MRFGAAASTLDSEFGDRDMGGLFAGLRTGPLVWLAEADLVRDKDLPEGTRSGLAALAEVNWGIRAGHNLKLTADYYDPDRDVSDDEQNRWSVVYELTPIPFLQVRAGYRRYDGISRRRHPEPSPDLRGVAWLLLAPEPRSRQRGACCETMAPRV